MAATTDPNLPVIYDEDAVRSLLRQHIDTRYGGNPDRFAVKHKVTGAYARMLLRNKRLPKWVLKALGLQRSDVYTEKTK